MSAPAEIREAEGARAAYEAQADKVSAAMEAKGIALACRAGCAHCCHSMVSVTAQEAFALAAGIEAMGAEGAALRAGILAHAAAHGAKGGGARVAAKLACPCLDPETKLCRIHPIRPLTCRGMNSVDEEACRRALEGGEAGAAIPSVLAFHRAVQTLYDQLGERLRKRGASPASLEMTGALAAIWSGPDALARWRAGEDIFAGCKAGALTDAPIPRFG